MIATRNFGRVAYTTGLSIDQPLSVIRFGYRSVMDQYGNAQTALDWAPFTLMPRWTTRGLADIGTFDDGGVDRCMSFQGVQRCIWVDWPAQVYAYARNSMRRNAWHGSVAEDKADAAGTYFRRNRQYDPQTGRFTQEDPIGLAGGLNLYGFAGGDPVNFSDPFGLCEPWPDCWFQGLANWGAARGDAVGSAALNIGAGLNAASEAFGTNDLGAAIGTGDVVGAGLALFTMLPLGKAAKAVRVADRVIGHLPAYRQVGQALGARFFDLGKLGRLLPDPVVWALNRRFLDAGIREGAEFVLATARNTIRAESWLEREVRYLLAHGYRWADNGMSLIPR